MLDEGRCQTPAEESVSTAAADGLRFVSDDSKGITRKLRGKAFQYLMPSGGPVKDQAELARIRKLAASGLPRRATKRLDEHGGLQFAVGNHVAA